MFRSNRAVTILVDAPEKEKKKEEDHLPTEPQGLALSTSLLGSFPSSPKTPPPISIPSPYPYSHPHTSRAPSRHPYIYTSTSTGTKAHAVQPRSASASALNRLRTPRTALNPALAMQLHPGLGTGADPAWMVRFLRMMLGWVVVLISGDV